MLLLSALLVAAAARVRYDGFKLVQVKVKTELQSQLLNLVTENPSAEIRWMGDSATVPLGGVAELALSPAAFDALSQVFGEDSITIQIEDLQAQFDENEKIEKAHPYNGYNTPSRNEFFEAYRDYEEIVDYIDGLVAQYPTLTRKVASIGQSSQGRDIFAIRISNFNITTPKVGIFWNGLQHCREWIAGHSLIYVLDSLITRYGIDPQITALVDQMEFTIVPVFNPDGYIHTRTVDNMWRKNRQSNAGSPCIGTDLNRNWQFEWATVGSSNNPCSDTYHGPAYYSGPETRAVASYVQNNPSIRGYMDWHSSGNLWMTPWGCYTQLPPDYPAMKRTGDAAAAAIRSSRGTVYQVGSIANIIYEAAGSSADTVYGLFGLVQSHALEIGTSFQPNAREIIPTGEEMLLGALVHAEFTLEESRK